MKKNRPVTKQVGPPEANQGLTLSDREENKPSIESLLSPDRMAEGASTTTALLDQILAQREENRQSSHWGINE